MKSLIVCLELLLKGAVIIANLKRQIAELTSTTKEEIAAANQRAAELEARNVESAKAIESLSAALQASQADDSQVSELEKQAAEVLGQIGDAYTEEGLVASAELSAKAKK